MEYHKMAKQFLYFYDAEYNVVHMCFEENKEWKLKCG